jgi:hypothetical protein
MGRNELSSPIVEGNKLDYSGEKEQGEVDDEIGESERKERNVP